MCGIAGFIGAVPDGIEPQAALRRMARAIAHRGPDDEGFLSASAAGGRVLVGLAHRRLSIIDLNTGHQPLGNEDRKIQIVFNGEIYNFQELRRDLQARGHAFRTVSDTEVIVHAYEQWGEDCVERLRGMFAFAIWDARREQLMLARDRFGKKTLFAGIRKLPPGFTAVWRDGRLQETRYFIAPDGRPRVEEPVPECPEREFLQRLDEAVEMRMVADVPFGAFLSGGIDSSTVVGLMSCHSERPVKTFSVGFDDPENNELGYARQVAEHLATDHHELQIAATQVMDELPALIGFRDAPVSEPSDVPIYLMAREARRHVKMVLTGEGADEILGGYPKHRFEPLGRYYRLLPGALRHRLLEPLLDQLPFAFRRARTAVGALGLEQFDERMARWFGALSASEREHLVAFAPSGEPLNVQ